MLFGDSPPPGLVGIAKLAARSEVLEAKRSSSIRDRLQDVLNRTRPGMPFGWSLNPYRGCEFGCRYCYARYTHEFMELRDSADFEDRIYAKSNLAPDSKTRVETGETAKAGSRSGRRPIRISRLSDASGERSQRSKCLRSKAALSLSITTKSDLVKRDIPLLRKIAKRNAISVNMTITTLDAELARLLEPRAPRPDLRLAAVRELTDAGIPVGVFPNPIMPLITDQERRLDRLAKAARDHGATYFGGGVLFLMPCSRRVFFPFVEKHFPHLLRRYQERYEGAAYLKGPYRETIRDRIAAIRDRYGLKSSPPHRDFAAMEEAQGWLFG